MAGLPDKNSDYARVEYANYNSFHFIAIVNNQILLSDIGTSVTQAKIRLNGVKTTPLSAI